MSVFFCFPSEEACLRERGLSADGIEMHSRFRARRSELSQDETATCLEARFMGFSPFPFAFLNQWRFSFGACLSHS